MRPVDPTKRQRIIDAATRLFATRPFHEVRLDDVAAEARVGKGTVYLYYTSKDDLYLSLLLDGFAHLVDRLGDGGLDGLDPEAALRHTVDQLVTFSFAHPHFFELTRRVGVPTGQPEWEAKRRELFDIIEGVIRRGIAEGRFEDPLPQLTARYLPSLIRAALLFMPDELTPDALTDHIVRTLLGSLHSNVARRSRPSRSRRTTRSARSK
ncbi:MAG: TetR family transcriptional regulator [Phycisphaera sp.]|nr:TetR family transcriptional regulator [Phycisphaera sp.]